MDQRSWFRNRAERSPERGRERARFRRRVHSNCGAALRPCRHRAQRQPATGRGATRRTRWARCARALPRLILRRMGRRRDRRAEPTRGHPLLARTRRDRCSRAARPTRGRHPTLATIRPLRQHVDLVRRSSYMRRLSDGEDPKSDAGVSASIRRATPRKASTSSPESISSKTAMDGGNTPAGRSRFACVPRPRDRHSGSVRKLGYRTIFDASGAHGAGTSSRARRRAEKAATPPCLNQAEGAPQPDCRARNSRA